MRKVFCLLMRVSGKFVIDSKLSLWLSFSLESLCREIFLKECLRSLNDFFSEKLFSSATDEIKFTSMPSRAGLENSRSFETLKGLESPKLNTRIELKVLWILKQFPNSPKTFFEFIRKTSSSLRTISAVLKTNECVESHLDVDCREKVALMRNYIWWLKSVTREQILCLMSVRPFYHSSSIELRSLLFPNVTLEIVCSMFTSLSNRKRATNSLDDFPH